MTLDKIQAAVLAAVIAALGAGLGYGLASHRASAPAPAAPSGATDGRKVLYWYDPMSPGQHFDKPGKSPFMDMQLVAKYADDGAAESGVKIDPGMAQNLGLRLATVERGPLTAVVDAVGTVQWNDRQVAVVQARSAGFVERVYARAPGDVVAKGAPLADLLVPDWAGSQTEYLALLASGDAGLAQAARERMVLQGMPAELIDRVAATRRVHAVVTVAAPIGGVIQSLDVRTGMSLGAGMPLARINGLDPVWIDVAVPEAQAGGVAVGNPVQVSLATDPGRALSGKVVAVLPQANADSRTLSVRVELPNPGGRLRAGLFAQVRVAAGNDGPVLHVPSEAVLRTGTRNVVLRALDGGRFEPVEVRLGREAQGQVAVLDGLREGQRIVASGQFLIDSEASLQGVLARMAGASDAAAAPAATASAASAAAASVLHEADGTVESIDGREIVLSHGPVKSLGWGPMTMPFQLADPALAATLKPGDRVHFGFRQRDDENVIELLRKSGGAR